jgi:hypothetical protein
MTVFPPFAAVAEPAPLAITAVFASIVSVCVNVAPPPASPAIVSEVGVTDFPELVLGVLERPQNPLGQIGWFEGAPEPDVRVQKELHFRNASHSPAVAAGDTMSPTMRPVERSDPIHALEGFGGDGGLTSAIGSPLRVISSDWPVRLTLSRRARQVALNFEMLTVSTARTYDGL